ncbi:MAG: uncharacterized protein K0S71_2777 [Clostridia bacterium]|jgi:methyl-accepting chemotaxis protein|nr:uncharacterized protein [Clostridia bacterium]
MKMSLSKRITFFVGCLVLVISLVLGFSAFKFSENTTLYEVQNTLEQYAKVSAQHIDAKISLRIEILKEVAARETIKTMDWEIQRDSLKLDAERLEYLDLAVVLQNGTAQYVGTGETTELGDREYIKKALEGKPNVSDVIISKVTGKPVIMYAVPIERDGKVVGALIGRKDGTALNDITDELGVGETGYAFILGSDSTFYAHPNRELVISQRNVLSDIEANGSLKNFGIELSKLGLGKEGVVSYSFEGETRITAMAPIPNTNWTLGIGTYESDILSNMHKLRNVILFTSFLVILVGLIASVLLGKSISKPITYISRRIDSLSKYDLVFDKNDKIMRSLGRSDEIGTIARAVITMQENLTALIKKISSISQQVAASSEQLTSTSHEAATAVDEVARTIEEIARGASDQAKETQEGAMHINGLGEHIVENQNMMTRLNDAVEKVNRLRNKGAEALKVLVQKTNESDEAALRVQQIIIETNQSAEKIEIASQMIKSIADQTNLLALNAAIEAARAGDSGRGFAVVADEIRKLAEQSNRFTDEIAVIIEALTRKTEEAVKTMGQVGQIVAEQNQSVENTNKRFDGISDAIEKIRGIIESLNQSGLEMESKKEEIIGIIQNLSAISEENAAGSEEASASVEEQTASMTEIANASEALAKLAEEMQTDISRFKY